MAQPKKKWVAFRTNTPVPAAVIGAKADQKMQAGQPVQLPAAYADHVVHDGFAEFCDAPKAPDLGPKKAVSDSSPKKGAQTADLDAAAKLDAAQAKVDEAGAHLMAVAGTDAEEEARTALDLANAELAALQPAS
ncbi:hypothetical protein DL1_03280 [Thioclava dalianensis]|uniref:Uncharacterized protein n=1 Tax=Thioclava dalianensis TaxID=1185766 RepID=A0A074THM7_9RHOB|nr:hypothetical protein [Thioclava dalianensis]KEP69655.1 hypothetical protein DL1_03280 [Thioclava dalianensis]SFN16079.1 hypothetical protein SAMN05216224_102718 [Thioclava dalianensis]